MTEHPPPLSGMHPWLGRCRHAMSQTSRAEHAGVAVVAAASDGRVGHGVLDTSVVLLLPLMSDLRSLSPLFGGAVTFQQQAVQALQRCSENVSRSTGWPVTSAIRSKSLST